MIYNERLALELLAENCIDDLMKIESGSRSEWLNAMIETFHHDEKLQELFEESEELTVEACDRLSELALETVREVLGSFYKEGITRGELSRLQDFLYDEGYIFNN